MESLKKFITNTDSANIKNMDVWWVICMMSCVLIMMLVTLTTATTDYTVSNLKDYPYENKSFDCLHTYKENLKECVCHLTLDDFHIKTYDQCNINCEVLDFYNYTVYKYCNGALKGVYQLNITHSLDINRSLLDRLKYNIADYFVEILFVSILLCLLVILLRHLWYR